MYRAVIPAKAGTHTRNDAGSAVPFAIQSVWVPAFAGMTAGAGRHWGQSEHCRREIVPHGVFPLNQCDLPVALPFLDPFFTDDGVTYIVESLDVNQTLDAVLFGEAGNEAITMLNDALSQIAGGAGVESTVSAAGEDVDVAGHRARTLNHIVIPTEVGTHKLGTGKSHTIVEPARMGSGFRRNDEREGMAH